ncbi:MAG: sigma-54-dependent Fis family transcriptional regulator, partial [Candidatus Aminicenantes bacterium]|nr:sigma-54-dependent Fis family transcriptional regulator [Candidatus Aminicenantes bacterium]
AIRTEKRPDAVPSLLKNESYDVILLDMNFARGATSGREGFDWLSRILHLDPSAVVIMITAFGDVGMAVRAIKEGATDFVLKPWQNEKFLGTISAALNLRRSRLEASHLRLRQKQLSADLDKPFQDFLGHSPAMQSVFETIRKVADTEANVLILGENGTGKELVARELHRQSRRSGEVFIAVDMGALSESLFESELFGHVKGAFTDAREDRAGRFEVASGGTLFLDEIANLPLTLQAKILTALESRKVTRLGSNKEIPIDVRIICATNRPILDLANQGKFRQDLLYRINTVEIHLPPLRRKREDIPLLAEHFLKIYGKKYGRENKRLTPATVKKLESYGWPGNVRELQHAIERAVILSESDALQPADFFFPEETKKETPRVADELNLGKIENLAIHQALAKHGGNISQAAKELGLSRAALYRRLQKHDL